MGKRKSMKPVKAKKQFNKLETVFDCLQCAGEKTCYVNMDIKIRVADLRCIRCKEVFRTRIHRLSRPVDVYGEWVDAIEELKTNY